MRPSIPVMNKPKQNRAPLRRPLTDSDLGQVRGGDGERQQLLATPVLMGINR
jgi:hypothetical protein